MEVGFISSAELVITESIAIGASAIRTRCPTAGCMLVARARKMIKRMCASRGESRVTGTGFVALAPILTAIPSIPY